MVIDFRSITAAETETEQDRLPAPRIKVEEADDRYGRFSAEPLEPGFGITLGNALRRVLYNALPGTAITTVKIEAANPEHPEDTTLVLHEYTTIPMVRESVTEFLLNVKSVRLRSQVDRPGKLRLEVSGEGEVCAGDIMASADFEVVNPELHLATLDSPQARLSVEFTVERGKGFRAADTSGDRAIGVLPVDAIFTPIRKVAYNIERLRIGDRSDLERLILEVWTDGTISPVEALREASNMLVNLFFLFANVQVGGEDGAAERPLALHIPPEKYNVPVERLELSSRTLNCLRRANIEKVGQVLEMKRADLLAIRNFGEKSLEELYERLKDKDLLIPELDWGFDEAPQEEDQEPPEDSEEAEEE